MTNETLVPTLVRRQLGRRLKRRREQAGWTLKAVEDAKVFSQSKIIRMEAGKIPIAIRDIWALGHLYQLDPAETDALAKLSAGTANGSSGWWEGWGLDSVPDWLSLYAGLESAADKVQVFHPGLVPGLLQTEPYARALFASDTQLTTEVVQDRVAFRLARQRVFMERQTPLRVVLGQAALDVVVDGPDVMAEQKLHLLALAKHHHVQISVMPNSAGPAPCGAFTILRNEADEDPDTVYLETLLTGMYLEQPQQVEQHEQVFGLAERKSQSIEEYLK